MAVRLPSWAPLLCCAVAVSSLVPSLLAAASTDGSWSSVGPPTSRFEHSAIYDPVRDRMIVFGGYEGEGQHGNLMHRSDTWVLPLGMNSEWSQLVATRPGPLQRRGHTAIYDPVRDRMIVFGGHTNAPVRYNDVWALSLSGDPKWTRLMPVGPAPRSRYDHVAIYDPVRDAMVVYGGYDVGLLGDVWSLSLSGDPTWTQITPSTTDSIGRYRHGAVYDPIGDRMIVFGGTDWTKPYDTWALSLSTDHVWSRLTTSGTPPSPRSRHAVTYDHNGRRMIVFGGTDGTRRNEIWSLSFEDLRWTQSKPSGTTPSRRNEPSAVYDSRRDRLVIFGGYEVPSIGLGDTWSLPLASNGSRWSLITPAHHDLVESYVGSTSAYDSKRDRLIVFGGSTGRVLLSDTWALSLSTTPPLWSRVPTSGPLPTRRVQTAAIYDPIRDRVLVFGGLTADPSDQLTWLNDVWALSLSEPIQWTRLATEGSSPWPRAGASIIYDPEADRMIVYGGEAGFFQDWRAYDDVWQLSLSGPPTWTELRPTGPTPGRRTRHAAMLDPVRHRMLIFAGEPPSNSSHPSNVWALDLGETPSWTEIAAAAPEWQGSSQATLYDPVRDRVVSLMLLGFSQTEHETWALDLSGPREWKRLETTGRLPDFLGNPIYDPVRDRMMVFNGTYSAPFGLSWGDPVRPGVECPDGAKWSGSDLDLDYTIANPLAGERVVEWTLTSEPALPAFSRRGFLRVGPESETRLPLHLTAPPDGAEAITIRLAVTFGGAAGNAARHDLVLVTPRANEFALHGVRPNPSTHDMIAFFTLPTAGRVSLELFDLAGRRVGPTQEQSLPAGHHVMPIAARENLGPGIYFVRLGFAGRILHARAVVTP